MDAQTQQMRTDRLALVEALREPTMPCCPLQTWSRARLAREVLRLERENDQLRADAEYRDNAPSLNARCESQGHDWQDRVPASDGTGPSIYSCQWCGETSR